MYTIERFRKMPTPAGLLPCSEGAYSVSNLLHFSRPCPNEELFSTVSSDVGRAFAVALVKDIVLWRRSLSLRQWPMTLLLVVCHG